MIEIGIVGGSGYGAVELIRLLNQHKEVEIKYIFSHSKSGEAIKTRILIYKTVFRQNSQA